MNMPRILLIGYSGQVGAELLRVLQPLGEVVACGRNDPHLPLDLADHQALRETVRLVKPHIIVNAAAYTAVDKAEQEADAAMAINGIAPGILAEEARALGAALIHYSTDYVFNGKHNQPYRESDYPDPRSVYGQTKLVGEQAIQAVGGRYLILRTSWVYGTHGKNFLLTMQRLAAEHPELRVVSDQFGAPTWNRLIAEATGQIIAQLQFPSAALDWDKLSGSYHLTCGGITTWHGFASAIVASLPKPPPTLPTVTPIRTEEYPTPAARPAYSVLDNHKLAQTFNIRLPAWDKALEVCLRGF
jgi:dTDP-4-dehydrorhamnose reductase